MSPVQVFSPELLLRAQGIRGLLLDVDGVLTDGGLLKRLLFWSGFKGPSGQNGIGGFLFHG